MRRYLFILVLLTIATSGCGTLIPGPRYKVTLEDFSFNHDGSGVFYLEDDYRFYPLLLLYREKHYLYLYERETRRHRLIAKTDTFSVSPFGPYILYSPPWKKRFKNSEIVPDFYLLNYRTGKRMGYRMPRPFDEDYISYGFSNVRWEGNGALTAFVNFRYAPGKAPSKWLKQKSKPFDWYTRHWEVRIDPGEEGGKVDVVKAFKTNQVPGISWSEIRREKFVSPDGVTELAFSKYSDYFDFHSELAIMNRESGEKEYIVKENLLIGIAQAGKYIFYYVTMAPLLGLYDRCSQ